MAVAYDYHVHTSLSPDGVSSMEEYIGEALRRGMEGLCFTEHIDVLSPEVDFNPGTDLAAYQNAFQRVKERYGDALFLGFGLEAGILSWSAEATRAYMRGYGFDYVIASCHWPEGLPNLMYPENWAYVTRETALQRYLEGFYQSLGRYDDYDCIGHLTYFSRYCPLPDKKPRFADAPDQTTAILKHLIERGKGMEVNTSTYGKEGFTMPDLEIVRRYRELGGEIITLGSDAHEAGALCQSFSYAAGMLKEAGFTHYTVFAERRPRFLPL